MNYYVNPGSGSNGNPGTEDGPFATIAHLKTVWSANPSYVFLGWFDGATELSTDNPYIYTTGSENKILTAKFEINLSGPFIKKGKWKPVTIT